MIVSLLVPRFRVSDQNHPPKGYLSGTTTQVGRGRGYAVLQAIRGCISRGQSRGRGTGYQVLQTIRGVGRGYFRGNAREGFQDFQPQQSYSSQQETTQFGQYFDPTKSAQYGAIGEAKCGKCENVLYCLARITSNACIPDVWNISKDVAGWPAQTDEAQRRLPGIDAGQVVMQSRMQKNPISISL